MFNVLKIAISWHGDMVCYLISKSTLLTLWHLFLCRIKEFSEWAQCLVLELVAKYVPSDSEDIFDIMNLLEDRLQHANGAVVLATIKVFLHLTLSMTDVHQQVFLIILFVPFFFPLQPKLAVKSVYFALHEPIYNA